MSKLPDDTLKAQAAAVRARMDHFLKDGLESIEAHRRRCLGENFRERQADLASERARLIIIFGADTCAGCRFFLPGQGTRGHCRRTRGHGGRDPNYSPDDWCGNHKPLIVDHGDA